MEEQRVWKVGFLQIAPVLGDREANIRKIDAHRDALAGADLVVFPELCATGYNFVSAEQARELAEPIGDSVYLEYLESLCHDLDLHVVSGFNEWDGRLYNTAVLVGPGGYVGRYRKLHLFLNEKDIFTPGDEGLPVFDIGPCRVGMMICFDWIFPETWRVLALEGADVICLPSNLILPGLCQRAVPVQAMSNRVHVVLANRTGAEGDLSFTGCSTISDARGNVLGQADATEEVVMTAEFDVAQARDKMVTPRNDLFSDRRPDQYARLVAKE